MRNSILSVLTTCWCAVFLLLGAEMAAAPAALAQSAEKQVVSGSVKDAFGPVVGATVTIKDSTVGTVTGSDGTFELSGNMGDVIVVSFVGLAPQQIVFAGQTFLDITLAESASEIESVVVTAMGIKRQEKALSYNVQQVKADEITAVKYANLMNSLFGKVSGVQINAGANGAGGESRVVMRGTKSLTGSNLALYVIDGIPMFNLSNTVDGSNLSDQPGTDGVADINPDDIESITMLTGPSAAALYGNAAASGVVLITTKKGTAGKTTVTVSNSTTFSQVYMMPRMQSKYGNAIGKVVSWGNVVNSDYDPRDFFNTGANVINTVSLSTGNQRNQTYASVSTTNTTGTLPNTAYDRYNFTVRNTTSLAKDKLTLDVGGSFIKQYDRNMTSQGLYYNALTGL